MKPTINLIYILLLFLSCNSINKSPISNQKSTFNTNYPKIESKSAINDINYILERLEEVHYNPYLNISKEEIKRTQQSIISSWSNTDSIYISEFAISTMNLLAKLDDGHTNVRWFSKNLLINRDLTKFLPIILSYSSEQNAVVINNSDSIDLSSSKIVKSINNYNVNQLYLDALSCLPGEMSNRAELASNIFFPIYLHLKGINPPFQLEFENHEQLVIDENKVCDFHTLFDRLRPFHENYTFDLMQNNIGYLSYNSCQNYPEFELFLKNTFEQIHELGIDKLIIDIRNNSGGNSSLNKLLLSYLTKKGYCESSKRLWKYSEVSEDHLIQNGYKEHFGDSFIEDHFVPNSSDILDFEFDNLTMPNTPPNYFEGKSCLLIGPLTFSSANFLADAVSTFDICTLIGSSTGQRATDFGEQKTEKLPSTNIPFSYTIAYDIRASGKIDDTSPVQPDIFVQSNVLEYAINWINK